MRARDSSAARKSLSFVEALEAAREHKGWTVEEIAGLLGVSPFTVQSWLKPDSSGSSRGAPSWAAHALMALVTGKPLSERRGELEITYAPATSGYPRAPTAENTLDRVQRTLYI